MFSKPSHKVTKSFIQDVSLNLDKSYMDNPDNTTIIRITFLDEKAKEPLIYKTIKKFDIEINILSGKMSIQERTYGNLVVGLRGDEKKVEEAIDYLKNQGIIVEELKLNGSIN